MTRGGVMTPESVWTFRIAPGTALPDLEDEGVLCEQSADAVTWAQWTIPLRDDTHYIRLRPGDPKTWVTRNVYIDLEEPTP